MKSIEIKEVMESDLNALQEIGIRSFREAYEPVEDPVQFQKYIDQAYDRAKLYQELNNPESDHFFILKDGQIAGYLKTNMGASQTEKMNDSYLEIQRIYLLRSFYGQGMGRLLINKAIEIARKRNKLKIWLGVWEENLQAITFYKHLGFKITGSHTFFVGSKEEFDWIMEMEVDELKSKSK